MMSWIKADADQRRMKIQSRWVDYVNDWTTTARWMTYRCHDSSSRQELCHSLTTTWEFRHVPRNQKRNFHSPLIPINSLYSRFAVALSIHCLHSYSSLHHHCCNSIDLRMMNSLNEVTRMMLILLVDGGQVSMKVVASSSIRTGRR
jgi:hypothetical protein